MCKRSLIHWMCYITNVLSNWCDGELHQLTQVFTHKFQSIRLNDNIGIFSTLFDNDYEFQHVFSIWLAKNKKTNQLTVFSPNTWMMIKCGQNNNNLLKNSINQSRCIFSFDFFSSSGHLSMPIAWIEIYK